MTVGACVCSAGSSDMQGTSNGASDGPNTPTSQNPQEYVISDICIFIPQQCFLQLIMSVHTTIIENGPSCQANRKVMACLQQRPDH